MNATVDTEPQQRLIALPARGGAMAALDFGPPNRPVDIVFSHANGFNGRTYRTILQPLASRLRILALDLRGHGASTLPTVIEGRAGWTEFRDDLLALLEAVATGPVVLAGHSMGGTSSLLAAAAQPERTFPPEPPDHLQILVALASELQDELGHVHVEYRGKQEVVMTFPGQPSVAVSVADVEPPRHAHVLGIAG